MFSLKEFCNHLSKMLKVVQRYRKDKHEVLLKINGYYIFKRNAIQRQRTEPSSRGRFVCLVSQDKRDAHSNVFVSYGSNPSKRLRSEERGECRQDVRFS